LSRPRLEFRRDAVDGTLAIDGVLACDGVVEALLARLRRSDAATLAMLRGVFTPTLAVVLGPTDALPWVDGLRYLTRAAGEPNLLLPTDVQMNVAPRVVLRAFLGRPEAPRPPVVLVPERRWFVSIAESRSLAALAAAPGARDA
jgi:hypothetical protein